MAATLRSPTHAICQTLRVFTPSVSTNTTTNLHGTLSAQLNQTCTHLHHITHINNTVWQLLLHCLIELVTSETNWQLIWRQVIKWPLIMLLACWTRLDHVSSFCEEMWVTGRSLPLTLPPQDEGQRADIEKIGVERVRLTLVRRCDPQIQSELRAQYELGLWPICYGATCGMSD